MPQARPIDPPRHPPRPVRWPEATTEPPAATSPQARAAAAAAATPPAETLPHGPFGIAPSSLVDEAAPELAQALGLRLSLALVPPESGDDPDTAGRADRWAPLAILSRAGERHLLELDPPLVTLLLEIALGGDPRLGGHAPVPGRQTAGWAMLATMLSGALAGACNRCLSGGARVSAEAVAQASAVGGAEERGRLALRLDTEGGGGILSLRRLPHEAPHGARPSAAAAPAAAAGPAASADGGAWRARAQALAAEVETEVTLQLGEIRMPLAALLRLGPGDMLPIERPRLLRLVSGGRVISTMPATALAARARGSAERT